MKRVMSSLFAVSLLLSGSVFAQQPPDQDSNPNQQENRGGHDHQNQDRPPQRGDRLDKGDRGEPVADYGRHGLKRPPRGHEWRKVDDRYVLIAVATGVISSVILANH